MWGGRKSNMIRSLVIAGSVISLIILLAFTLSGCGSGGAAGQKTGSITAQLDWSKINGVKTAAAHTSTAPAGVVTVRIVVSGPGISTIQKDFDASLGQGQIDDVPVATDLTVTADGLNANGNLTAQGSVSNVTVVAGKTTDVGVITMIPIPTPTPTTPINIGISFPSTPLPSSQGTVSGIVTSNSPTGAPVAGVTVTLLQQGSQVATTTTGTDGAYTFGALPAGDYTIVFSKSGFQTTSSNITVVAGADLTVNTVAVTTSVLPSGFPADVPNGNYRIDLQICAQTPQGDSCAPIISGVATISNVDINQFAQSLVDQLNQQTAQAQPSCSQAGGQCSFSISYTPWNGVSFSIVETFTVTSGGQTLSGSITFIVTKVQ